MSFQGRLAIGAKDVDGLDGFLVHILDEFLNRLRQNLALRAGEQTMIRRESFYPLSSLRLLELAVGRSALARSRRERSDIPIPAVLEVIERIDHCE